MVLRVAQIALSIPPPAQVTDTYDTQMAIKQILLRSGWAMGPRGKLLKKVKQPFRSSFKTYFVEVLPSGRMITRDQTGRVSAKVDLHRVRGTSAIMEAARALNNGAPKTVV